MSTFLPMIRRHYSELTPAQKRLADYVLHYPSEVVQLSAAELAQRCRTAPSAVIRLCKSLGFGGYSAFKLQLAVALQQSTPDGYMPGIERNDSPGTVLDKVFSANIKALRDTAARLDRQAFTQVTQLLYGANNIFIYGVGTSAGPAQDLQYRLMLLGFRAQVFTDIVAMRLSTMNLQPGDVAVGISHTGRTAATVDAMKLAKAAGADTVCLTSFPASDIAELCHHVLAVYCDETQYPMEAVSARIAHSGVIDALVAALSVARYDTAAQRSRQIHDIMETVRPKRRKS